MKAFLLIVIIFLLVIIVNTHKAQVPVAENNTNQLFEIVDIKIDSMIEITFQNVNTAEMYKLNYLKKYCKNIDSIELGSEWSLPVLSKNTQQYLMAANLVCEK